ncbi:Kelch repeat-containing protein [Microbulbifer echini]|uniref:Kelch repeat-containing protein n=1 Tax=Microbulbifer echini TaxID=1529067 RepID=A0ABV4NMF3_9GAMM
MYFSRRNFLKLTGLAPLVIGGTSGKAETIWERPQLYFSRLPDLAIPIQEIYPTAFAGEIFVSGGLTPSSTPIFYDLSPSKRCYIFSPKILTWRKGPSLPEARHHLGMAANSNYLYGIGGFHGKKDDAWQAMATVYRLTRNGNEWDSAPQLPTPIAESIYTNISETIHVVGGKSPNNHSRNIDTKNHYVLIGNTDWETAAPATIRRNSAAGTVVNNRIYVIGGRQTSNGNTKARNLAYAEAYDPNLDQWEKIRPLPQALAGLTAAPLNGKIVVTGGEAFGPNGNWKTGTAFSTVWAYDPISDQWSKESPLSEARHGHGAVTIDNSLYIIGGAAKVGPQKTLASTIKLSWKY